MNTVTIKAFYDELEKIASIGYSDSISELSSKAQASGKPKPTVSNADFSVYINPKKEGGWDIGSLDNGPRPRNRTSPKYVYDESSNKILRTRGPLEKVAVLPLLELGLAGAEGAVGSYKAIKHGKAPLATKLPYNPMLMPGWAVGKGLHSASSRWTQDPNRLKRYIGRAGLAASKIQDAALQIDPINMVGGFAHDFIKSRRGRVVPPTQNI